MHKNSVEAYFETSSVRAKRAKKVLGVYGSERLTDRQVMQRLGYVEINAVQPRITELIEAGALKEYGKAKDPTTHRTVRIVGIPPKEGSQQTLFNSVPEKKWWDD